jgi:hypothetical protein
MMLLLGQRGLLWASLPLCTETLSSLLTRLAHNGDKSPAANSFSRESNPMKAATKIILCLTLALMSGCTGDHGHDHDHGDHAGHDHGEKPKDGDKGEHLHKAPHGGTLVALGDHVAMIEVTLKKGQLTIYCLDKEGANGVIPKQTSIDLKITHEKQSFNLTLKAVANSLTGETSEKSSQFSVEDKQLLTMTKFQATVASINIKGKEFKALSFPFPKGKDHH